MDNYNKLCKDDLALVRKGTISNPGVTTKLNELFCTLTQLKLRYCSPFKKNSHEEHYINKATVGKHNIYLLSINIIWLQQQIIYDME